MSNFNLNLYNSLQEKSFITQKKKKKNHCGNIKVIAIVDMSCCNKFWGNKFVQQKISLI